MKYLRTSDLARPVGIHANTVRRYVDRGILPPVEYSASGYRRFTRHHLDCLRLACQVYRGQYPGKAMFQSGIRIVQTTVGGDLGGALELAYNHLTLVQSERVQADVAADLYAHQGYKINMKTKHTPFPIYLLPFSQRGCRRSQETR